MQRYCFISLLFLLPVACEPPSVGSDAGDAAGEGGSLPEGDGGDVRDGGSLPEGDGGDVGDGGAVDPCSVANRSCSSLTLQDACAACFRGFCFFAPGEEQQTCITSDPAPFCGSETTALRPASNAAEAPFVAAGVYLSHPENAPVNDPCLPDREGWTVRLTFVPNGVPSTVLVAVEGSVFSGELVDDGLAQGSEAEPVRLVNDGHALVCLPYPLSIVKRVPPLTAGVQMVGAGGVVSPRTCGSFRTEVSPP